MKRFIHILALVLAAICLQSCLAGKFMCNYALQPTPHGIDDIERTRHKADSLLPGSTAWYDALKADGILKDTTILGYKDRKVHACYVPAKDPAKAKGTAIVVHGYTDNHYVFLYLVRMYRDDFNYNVLFPDLVYHGYSEGDAVQMGWFDRYDVEKWVEVAHNIFQDDFMVLHGVSMGAATVMMASGDDLPEYVRAFVEDCGYSTEVEIVPTRGDRDTAGSIREIGGDGLFIREIEDTLLRGETDIAVHSAKDLPYELKEGLVIGGVPDAADGRDCLVLRKEMVRRIAKREPQEITKTVIFSSFRGRFPCFTGKQASRPSRWARQKSAAGQLPQRGADPGRQILSPSSMRASLKAPGSPGGMASRTRASALRRVPTAEISDPSALRRVRTRRTFPSTAGIGRDQAMEPMAPAV